MERKIKGVKKRVPFKRHSPKLPDKAKNSACMEHFSGKALKALLHPGLFGDLSGDPYDQAGSGNSEKNAGDPAVADSDQIAQESADKAADKAKKRIPKKTLGAVLHNLIGGGSAQSSNAQGNQQVN